MQRRCQALSALPPIDSVVNVDDLADLCAAHSAALGDARQQARFLCGLSGPAFTQARLSRQPLFGVLEERRFADVLAWCQQQAPLARPMPWLHPEVRPAQQRWNGGTAYARPWRGCSTSTAFSLAFVLILIEEAGVPVPIPGDFLMLLLGVHARQGRVPLWQALLVMELATLIGATVLYLAASRGGGAWCTAMGATCI